MKTIRVPSNPNHKQRCHYAVRKLTPTPVVMDVLASLVAVAYQPKAEQPSNMKELVQFIKAAEIK